MHGQSTEGPGRKRTMRGQSTEGPGRKRTMRGQRDDVINEKVDLRVSTRRNKLPECSRGLRDQLRTAKQTGPDPGVDQGASGASIKALGVEL